MYTSKSEIKRPADAQKALNIKDDGKPLTAPEFKEGNALVKGQFLAYRPELGYEVTFYVNDPIIGGQENLLR